MAHVEPYPTQGLTSLPHKLKAEKRGESGEKEDCVAGTRPHGTLSLGQG